MTSLAYLHDCHCCYNERSIVQKKKDAVVFLRLHLPPGRLRFGFHRCLYIQGCFATGGAITVAAFYMFFGKWVISEWYMPLH